VRAMTVVVSDVLREHSPEVNFAEDQQVIEAFASRASDPALVKGALIRDSRSNLRIRTMRQCSGRCSIS